MTRAEVTLVVMAVALCVVAWLVVSTSLPRCEEDQVLVGRGDFENGRWSAYECGPALDDFGGYER